MLPSGGALPILSTLSLFAKSGLFEIEDFRLKLPSQPKWRDPENISAAMPMDREQNQSV
jgi:hypothetical protein